jgi:hypothetical protein
VWRELFSRGKCKERKDCGRVDVGDVLTQRRRDAEYAERYEPRNTLNTRKRRWLMFSRVEHVERVEGESVSQGAPSLRDGAMKSEYSHQ